MKYWCNPRWRMLKWLRCRFNGCCNWWSKLLPEEPRSVFVCQPDIRIALRLWICVCSGSISGRVAFSREIWRAIYSPLPEHQAWCCCCCCCSYLSPLLTTPASVSPSLFPPSCFLRSLRSLRALSLIVFLCPRVYFVLFLYCLLLIWIIDQSGREETGLCASKSVLGLDGVAWLTSQFKLQTWTVLNDSRRAKKNKNPQTTKMLSCGNEFEGVSRIRGVSKASFSAFSHLIASIVSQSGLWFFFFNRLSELLLIHLLF